MPRLPILAASPFHPPAAEADVFRAAVGWRRSSNRCRDATRGGFQQSTQVTGTLADRLQAFPCAELRLQAGELLNGRPTKNEVYPHRIAFNCLPQIDSFLDNGYTKEEMKMVNETRKIMGAEIKTTATCVRVPVFYAHSESINIETEKHITPKEARSILSKASGVIVVDDPDAQSYPMPVYCEGKDEVFVGRIRQDESVENGISMWVVSDNIRKGAALNAIQIAELL